MEQLQWQRFFLFILFGISLLCTTLGSGALAWHCVVVATVVGFLVELGFIYLDLLCEWNLSKKGCWVFPPFGVFPG